MSASNASVNLKDTIYIEEKKNSRLSVIISVAAHLIVFAAFKASNMIPKAAPVINEENYIDLGYQAFDEVPQVVDRIPAKVEQEVIQDKSEPVASAATEMQDQSSDIQGFQKEAVQPTTTASTGTFTTVPYYKIKPKYPKDALESGLEGHVMLTIDILEDGTVENIKVTGGEKLGVFESAATRAVSKWKYKPFTDESGSPIKKSQQMVKVDFKIKDELAN